MRVDQQRRMRRELIASPDGLPLSVLASRIGAASYERARQALDTMPDAVIDRWVPYRDDFEPVVMLAEIPEDCPHPKGRQPHAGRAVIRRMT